MEDVSGQLCPESEFTARSYPKKALPPVRNIPRIRPCLIARCNALMIDPLSSDWVPLEKKLFATEACDVAALAYPRLQVNLLGFPEQLSDL
jgi:hypothetical protein